MSEIGCKVSDNSPSTKFILYEGICSTVQMTALVAGEEADLKMLRISPAKAQ